MFCSGSQCRACIYFTRFFTVAITVVTPMIDLLPGGPVQKEKTRAWLARVLLAEPNISLMEISDRCLGLGDLSCAIHSEIGGFAVKLRLLATLDYRKTFDV